MPELAPELVAVLQYLAPGFIAAGIFYATTTHSKPTQFERVIQALMLTVVVRAAVAMERLLATSIGRLIVLGTWTDESTLVASIVTASIIGFTVSAAFNMDTVHSWLRRIGATRRTSHPTEWVGVFYKNPRFVILNLKDGTRVIGWPSVWPRSAEKGHFYLTRSTWHRTAGEQGTEKPEGILINVSDVTHIEFLKRETE
ncbi:hypothetical protein ABIE56_000647 [Luteibacter sp. 621]|jgi:hypothetical protein|uniref:DUF6338 family protein n=1 Tax=Luteibacter sp. 621 TaxID=3373916 RepID=UPI003D1DCA5A